MKVVQKSGFLFSFFINRKKTMYIQGQDNHLNF